MEIEKRTETPTGESFRAMDGREYADHWLYGRISVTRVPDFAAPALVRCADPASFQMVRLSESVNK
jgi:hypothetical protein